MIGAFCLISFMGSWNSFLWPQIILHHDHRFTLPIGLNQMVSPFGLRPLSDLSATATSWGWKAKKVGSAPVTMTCVAKDGETERNRA
jgi:ABC-type glycerol-3-phosphate transport system permease component